MPTPRIRPMTPADVEPVADAFVRESIGAIVASISSS